MHCVCKDPTKEKMVSSAASQNRGFLERATACTHCLQAPCILLLCLWSTWSKQALTASLVGATTAQITTEGVKKCGRRSSAFITQQQRLEHCSDR